MREAENTLFKSFVLCETTFEQIEAMPEDMQLKYYRMISLYGLYGILPELEGIELALWIPMRDLIRHSKCGHNGWTEKQSKRGRNGGAPLGNTNAQKKQPVDNQTTQNNVNNQTIKTIKTSHNDNDNDNVNANENINGNDNGKKRVHGDQSDQAVEPSVATVLEKPPSFLEESFSEKSENPEEPAQAKPDPKLKASETPETMLEPELRPKPGEPIPLWFRHRNSAATSPPDSALHPGLINVSRWFEDLRYYWNETMRDLKQFYSRSPAQLDYDSREIMLAAFSAFPDTAVVKRAIDNYHAVLSDTDKYDPAGSVYKNFIRFLKVGIDNYCDAVAPLERYIFPDYKKRLEEEEQKRRNYEKTQEMLHKAQKKAQKEKEEVA